MMILDYYTLNHSLLILQNSVDFQNLINYLLLLQNFVDYLYLINYRQQLQIVLVYRTQLEVQLLQNYFPDIHILIGIQQQYNQILDYYKHYNILQLLNYYFANQIRNLCLMLSNSDLDQMIQLARNRQNVICCSVTELHIFQKSIKIDLNRFWILPSH